MLLGGHERDNYRPCHMKQKHYLILSVSHLFQYFDILYFGAQTDYIGEKDEMVFKTVMTLS